MVKFEIQKSLPSEVFYEGGVLKNVAKFTGKPLYDSISLTQVFLFEICETFKNTFFTEHLWTTDSDCEKTEKNLSLELELNSVKRKKET